MSTDNQYPPIDFANVRAETVASGDTFEGFMEAVGLAGRDRVSEAEATKAAVQQRELNKRFMKGTNDMIEVKQYGWVIEENPTNPDYFMSFAIRTTGEVTISALKRRDKGKLEADGVASAEFTLPLWLAEMVVETMRTKKKLEALLDAEQARASDSSSHSQAAAHA